MSLRAKQLGRNTADQQKIEECFSSSRYLDKYLQYTAFLNLRMVANVVVNKVNISSYYAFVTVKAAGHRLCDIKTDHLTFIHVDKFRTILNICYTKNISHSGEDNS